MPPPEPLVVLTVTGVVCVVDLFVEGPLAAKVPFVEALPAAGDLPAVDALPEEDALPAKPVVEAAWAAARPNLVGAVNTTVLFITQFPLCVQLMVTPLWPDPIEQP